MGIFSFFRKKNNEALDVFYEKPGVEDNLSKSGGGIRTIKSAPEDVLGVAQDNCDQIFDLTQRLMEAQWEYDSVTAYLKDIQKLDVLSEDRWSVIQDHARQIMNLNKERDKQQKKGANTADVKFKHLLRYEDTILDEIRKMEEQEKYHLLIKSDMQQLEGERGSIIYQKEHAKGKREFLKKFSITAFVLVVSVFLLLFLLDAALEAKFEIPFFLSGIMALVVILYIVLELRSTAFVLKNSEAKLNRLIFLINKVKVKYVNSTNALDYVYEKYHVNSSQELRYLWEQYVKAKDEAARYRHNTQLLEFYHEELMNRLKEEGVLDTEVWIYQPEALLDEKEMVEVRHSLNVRRQKLRARMDSISNQLEALKTTLMEIRKQYPEYEEQIGAMLL